MSALIVNYGINGVKTLTIEHGETKTLKCGGEPMPHGYVVRVTFNTEGYVAYDEVTTVGREGRTRTFNCGSKTMATDIVITAGEYGGKDSPLPIEVATEAEMSALLTSATADSVGAVYKYTGETTDTFTSGALYIIAEESE